MPTKEVIAHIVIYAVAFAILATVLPWVVFVPLAVAIVIVHIYITQRMKKKRYMAVVESVRNIQTDMLPDFSDVHRGASVDTLIFKTLQEVASELERKCFQLVEKNIQLLSMKEIGMTIISALDETKVVDSVTSFIAKGLGFKEFFVTVFNAEDREFNIYSHSSKLGQTNERKYTCPLNSIGGLLKKSIVSRQSLLIKDTEMHPMGSVDGTDIFPDSPMKSFVMVPMLKSTVTQPCWIHDDCLQKKAGVEIENEQGIELDDVYCTACHRFPVLGVIGVTDGFRADMLSKVDLVSVETLALQVSTILENAQLYIELKNEESFRKNIINSMMNGLITVDTSGTIQFANQMAERISGYGSGELINMHVDDLIVDSVGTEEDGPVMQKLKSRKSGYQKEVWLVKKDNSKLPIVLNTSSLLDEDESVQGVLAVFYDITRIKRMEEKIMHLDKLAALGRFSSSIAHEIRNPLTGIAAGIQYLRRAGNIPDDQIDNVSFILGEVNRIDRLIGDLLNVVRIGDLVYESVKIETIIEKCMTSLRDLLEKKSIRIEPTYPENSRTVYVDMDRITQVMMNLLKNAIEATQEGGKIVVSVSFTDDVSDVLFDAIGNYAIIKVSDQGPGLTPEEKGRIFEPFFSTKPEGTGLGLYVAHSIVERHDGYIFVESAPGTGTVFTVYLPTERVQNGDPGKVRNPLGG